MRFQYSKEVSLGRRTQGHGFHMGFDELRIKPTYAPELLGRMLGCFLRSMSSPPPLCEVGRLECK